MAKGDKKSFLMIIATLIVPILSLGIISPLNKVFFILIYIGICFLTLSKLFTNRLRIKNIIIIIASVFEVLFIVISAFNAGSVSNYFERIKNFFNVSQETSSNNMILSDIGFESYFNNLNEQISRIDEKIENNKINIEKLDNNLNTIIDNPNNIYFTNNIDQIEIDQIVKLIDKWYNDQRDSFTDLRTDIYSLELFYKMYLSEEVYYYCNIIKAFEKFGVDVEKLELKENTLFIWDIETLFVTYNMQKKNLDNLCLDKNAMGESFDYNKYRVTMQKYSDTFDYSNWRRNYEDITAAETEEKLNNIIMMYYKKFIINFSEE